ncbi:MAG: DsbA family protein [Acidobacteria bacterium]|nr:DsbA family protein [Acidobacteriota bacterium]
MARVGSVLLIVALFVAIGWVARENPAGDRVDADWAARHDTQLRRILNLPGSMRLEFKEATQGPAPDYQQVKFEIVAGHRRQAFELTVSRDGRRVLYDRLYELDDPFRALREQIQLENVPARGPADAPLTIVEYSDYTCGYCRRFFETLEEPLFERYGSQVRLVIKQFPLTGLRSWSEEASLAAACAFRQGSEPFWGLHEKLFLEAPRLEKGRPVLLELGKQAGVDLPAFERCLDRGDALAEVARDRAEGDRLGVEGTPTFFVNGRPIPGLMAAEDFFAIVDEELAAARAR